MYSYALSHRAVDFSLRILKLNRPQGLTATNYQERTEGDWKKTKAHASGWYVSVISTVRVSLSLSLCLHMVALTQGSASLPCDRLDWPTDCPVMGRWHARHTSQ